MHRHTHTQTMFLWFWFLFIIIWAAAAATVCRMPPMCESPDWLTDCTLACWFVIQSPWSAVNASFRELRPLNLYCKPRHLFTLTRGCRGAYDCLSLLSLANTFAVEPLVSPLSFTLYIPFRVALRALFSTTELHWTDFILCPAAHTHTSAYEIGSFSWCQIRFSMTNFL